MAEIDDYPLLRLSMKPEDLLRMFNNLRNYNPHYKRWDYRINNMPQISDFEMLYLPARDKVILVCDKGDFESMNKISSYFTEAIRIQAKRFDSDDSVLDYWQANKKYICGQSEKIYKSTRPGALNDTIYKLKVGVGSFRPMVIASIIKTYRAKRVLDFSAGWGDRLIAAMAQNVDLYVGVDPNSLLHPKYKEIEDFFRPYSTTKVRMIQAPFEAEFDIDERFDLVFTSPPYYNLEIYSDEPTQSSRYGNLENWYSKFLMPSIKKAWAMLVDGGYMVLNINDFYDGTKYVERMINDINRFRDSIYFGLVSYAEVQKQAISPQPMWIWRKRILRQDEPITIGTVNYANDRFNVVADHLLPGGTKQRAWRVFDVPEDELVYASASQGGAQIALAMAGKLAGKRVIIFSQNAFHNMVFKARMYGAFIYVKEGKLSNVMRIAEEYARKNGARYIPFGFEFPEFAKELEHRLQDASQLIRPDSTIFVTVGSGTLAKILLKVFPKNKFILIAANTAWTFPEFENDPRITLYNAVETFLEPADIPPPYPSVPQYDAKLWRFVTEHGKSGDTIWNVACDKLPDES